MSEDKIAIISVGLLGILSLALSTTEKAKEQGAIGVAIFLFYNI